MSALYVTTQGAVVRREQGRLVVWKDEERLVSIPETDVERVVLFGAVQITTQAATFLMTNGVETTFLTSTGRLLGKLMPVERRGGEIRLAQYQRHLDPQFRLAVAQAVVDAKIANARRVLQKYVANHPCAEVEQAIRDLDAARDRASRADTSDSLLGIEGSAAASYFGAFGHLLEGRMEFTKRTRRPPTDPVNAMLSFGYTLVGNELISAVSATGLDPYCGFFHAMGYNRPSLALDLLEEFRAPLVDRLVVSLVTLRVLRAEHFMPEGGGILMTDAGRKLFLEQYEKRMDTEFELGDGERANYRGLLARQASAMASAIRTGGSYRPYQFR